MVFTDGKGGDEEGIKYGDRTSRLSDVWTHKFVQSQLLSRFINTGGWVLR